MTATGAEAMRLPIKLPAVSFRRIKNHPPYGRPGDPYPVSDSPVSPVRQNLFHLYETHCRNLIGNGIAQRL